MFQAIVDFIVGFSLIFWSIILSLLAPFFPKGYFNKNVKGQTVLITGGGSGFGRLLAKKFALDHKATVVIWDVNKDGLETTKNLIKDAGGKCFAYWVDVSSREDVYGVAKKVEAEVGKVDILINNAGVVEGQFLLDVVDDRIERMFKINILAHYWTTKAFLPGMISKKQGHIVTIASAAGLFGAPRLTGYCATKSAAIGFHDALGKEVQVLYPDAKISTTVVCPYFVRTPIIAGKEHLIPPSSFFLPIREPEEVVDEMMDAILSNQSMLIPSWGIRFLLFLKANLPCRVLDQIQKSTIRMPVKKDAGKSK